MHSPAKEKLHPLEAYSALIDRSLGNRYHPSIFYTLRKHWRYLSVDPQQVRASLFPLEELLADPLKADLIVREFSLDFANRSLLRLTIPRLQVVSMRFGIDDQIPKPISMIQEKLNLSRNGVFSLQNRAFKEIRIYLREKMAVEESENQTDTQNQISLALKDYLLKR